MSQTNLFPFFDTAVSAISFVALCVVPLVLMPYCVRLLRATQQRLFPDNRQAIGESAGTTRRK